MEIECPCCQHPVRLTGAELTAPMSEFYGQANIDCPNCGVVTLGTELGNTLSQSPRFPAKGARVVGHFTLSDLLGQGAFGAVYLANDVNLGRQVALKLPIAREGETINLIHEAQAAAKLNHANIVSVYEAGTVDGQVYIASEYIEGLNLRDLLSAGKPDIERTIDLLIPISDALHYAHQEGIVHRDVKPANIMVSSDGKPHIADFGIAKKISTEATISTEGRIMGTARYMSPEQASGKTQETDHRSDIYAIGVMLFEMLTGDVPFRGNVRAVLHNKIFEEAPSPRSLNSNVPKDLETICLRCLERDPQRRFDTAKVLADELRRFASGEPIQARPVSSVERMWRWCRRRPAVSLLASALTIALVVGVSGISLLAWRASRDAVATQQALYRAQMNLCTEYLERGDVAGVQQTLDRFTDDDLPDVPDFAWRFFDQSLRPYQRIVNQGEQVEDVAVSQDGELFAASGGTARIRVWQNREQSGEPHGEGERPPVILTAKSVVHCLAFSPTTNQLAAGCADGVFRVWNPSRSETPIQSTKHGRAIRHIKYSADGKQLLTCADSGAARVWDVQREKLIAEIPTSASGAKELQFSPDGKTLVVASKDDRFRFWDIGETTLLRQLPDLGVVEHFCFSPDGQDIVTSTQYGDIKVWNADTGMLKVEFPTHLGQVGTICPIHHSSYVAISGITGTTLVIDLESLAVVANQRTHNLSDGVLASSANGKHLVVGSGDGSVKLLDILRMSRRHVVWHDSHVRSLAFLPGDRQLVAGTGDGKVMLVNLEDGQTSVIPILKQDERGEVRAVSGLGSNDRGARFVAAHASTIDLFELDDAAATLPAPQSIGEPVTGLAAIEQGRDGAIVVIGRSTANIYSAEMSPLAKIAVEGDSIVSSCIYDGGAKLALGTSGKRLLFYSIPAGASFRSPIIVDSVPHAIAASRETFIVGTDTGQLQFWNLSNSSIRSRIKAHTSRINVVTMFPDRRSFVSAGRDRKLRLWDVQSGERITTLLGHPRQVFDIAVASDGRTIASCGLAGDVRIWRTK
jgi:serine/threonine protein kinase/WD40 repeat protein